MFRGKLFESVMDGCHDDIYLRPRVRVNMIYASPTRLSMFVQKQCPYSIPIPYNRVEGLEADVVGR